MHKTVTSLMPRRSKKKKEGMHMSTSQPLKRKTDIENLKNYFYEKEEYRNYALIIMGLNTALRISDLLCLMWKDVLDDTNGQYQEHISVIEQKTQKESQIPLNPSVCTALDLYRKQMEPQKKSPYLFFSQKSPYEPLTRIQAYRIIQHAVHDLSIPGHISCHSLRKTFGYQAWKEGAEPALLMSIFNHSSYEITKRYLCIDQEDKDRLFMKINL